VRAEQRPGDPALAGIHDLPIDVAIGDRRLVGVVRGIEDGVFLSWQYSALGAKHRLELWVRHLALVAQYPELRIRSVLVARDGHAEAVCGFEGIGEATARSHLAALIALFDRGKHRPLPLFENCSPAYAEVMWEAEQDARGNPGKYVDLRTDAAFPDQERDPTYEEIEQAVEIARERAEQKAEEAAENRWKIGYQGYGGDLGEEHVAHCYGDDCSFAKVFSDDFREIAEAVWFPILDAEAAT
jgi:exonuclease V gamma subunit